MKFERQTHNTITCGRAHGTAYANFDLKINFDFRSQFGGNFNSGVSIVKEKTFGTERIAYLRKFFFISLGKEGSRQVAPIKAGHCGSIYHKYLLDSI